MLSQAIIVDDQLLFTRILNTHTDKKTLPLVIDHTDQWGLTPLQQAAKLGRVKMMWRLLSLGADINKAGSCHFSALTLTAASARSPLMHAVTAGHPYAVNLLQLMGAKKDDRQMNWIRCIH